MNNLKNKSLLFTRKAMSFNVFILVLLLVSVFSIYIVLASAIVTPTITPGIYNFNEDSNNAYNFTISNDINNPKIVNVMINVSQIINGGVGTIHNNSDWTDTNASFSINAYSFLNWSNVSTFLIDNGSSNSFRINMSIFTPGQYNLTFYFIFDEGILVTSKVTLNINATIPLPPLVSFVSLVNSGNYSGTLFLNSSVVNVTGLTDSVYYNITNNTYSWIVSASQIGSSWNATFDSSILNDGYYNITIYSNDSSGNTNNTEKVLNILIDNTYPSLSFGTLTSSNGVNVSRNWIIVNVSNTETNKKNITFNLYNSSFGLVNFSNFNTEAVGVYSINWTGLSDGIYYYNVSSFDIVNHANHTGIRSIILDNAGPSFTVYSPINTSIYYVDQNIPIYFRSEDNIGVDKIWFTYNETLNVSNLGTNGSLNFKYLSSTLRFLSAGQKNVTIYSNDSIGNINSRVIYISVIALPNNTVIPNGTTYSVNNTNGSSQIVIPYNSTIQNITVSENVSNNASITIDLSQLGTGNNTVLIGEYNLTFIRYSNVSTNYSNFTLVLIGNTSISGPENWSGNITLPIINVTSNFTPPDVSGYNNTLVEVISVGYSGLNLSSPAKIVFSGRAGNRAGWNESGLNLSQINTYCNNNESIPTNINSSVRECYTNDSTNTDLIIWTYHFTNFGVYSSIVLSEVAPENTNNGGGHGGGGGGGGGGTVSKWVKEIKLNDSEMNLGQILKQLKKNYRLTFNIKGVGHSVGIINITSTSATIEVASTPQIETLLIGTSKKFDLDSDGYYDLIVGLTSIYNGDANVTLKTTNEIIPKNINLTDNKPVSNSSQIDIISNNTSGVVSSNGKILGFGIWRYLIIALLIIIISYIISLISKAIKASNNLSDAQISSRLSNSAIKKYK